MENGVRSIFITGWAGTSKSTLLNYFHTTTQKKVAVLATTGVTALNVKGQTIHSSGSSQASPPTVLAGQVRKPALRWSIADFGAPPTV
ncbi:MAG: hypothetical protein HY669_02075 [Chloroflexi bacterium]|nr:hypothetical protein [Chloroflexota bacterium]